MKELTIEEKAKRYDERLAKARKEYSIHEANNAISIMDALERVFPELTEFEDERIMEKVIATIHLYYGEPLEDEAKEMIAWLEEQGEHANFRNKIQIGDKVTRNEDGGLVNLSQLKRVANKDEKQGEQKPKRMVSAEAKEAMYDKPA